MPAPTGDRDLLYFGVGMYAWTLKLSLWMLLLAGCSCTGCAVGDNDGPAFNASELAAPCTLFEARIVPAGHDTEVPSIEPAPLGVRIVVDAKFDPFMGASSPVPGGRMVWSVWIYHWYDGDYLGAIGRVPDANDDPRGGMCQWYEPI